MTCYAGNSTRVFHAVIYFGYFNRVGAGTVPLAIAQSLLCISKEASSNTRFLCQAHFKLCHNSQPKLGGVRQSLCLEGMMSTGPLARPPAGLAGPANLTRSGGGDGGGGGDDCGGGGGEIITSERYTSNRAFEVPCKFRVSSWAASQFQKYFNLKKNILKYWCRSMQRTEGPLPGSLASIKQGSILPPNHLNPGSFMLRPGP